MRTSISVFFPIRERIICLTNILQINVATNCGNKGPLVRYTVNAALFAERRGMSQGGGLRNRVSMFDH